jgi:hypothetical protein
MSVGQELLLEKGKRSVIHEEETPHMLDRASYREVASQ